VSMTAQNAQGTTRVQRIQPDFSQGLRELRRRDSLLRTAFLRIIAGFECRPSPRSPWDRAADGTQAPWGKLVVAIRGAILSARQRGEGNPIKILNNVSKRAMNSSTRSRPTSFAPFQKAEEFSLVAACDSEAEASSEGKVERCAWWPTRHRLKPSARSPLAREESTLVRLIDRVPALRQTISDEGSAMIIQWSAVALVAARLATKS
jgi:hypothetical protein